MSKKCQSTKCYELNSILKFFSSCHFLDIFYMIFKLLDLQSLFNDQLSRVWRDVSE
jgi:hypothetical protein